MAHMLFLSFVTQSNGDQFTRNFYQNVAEETLISLPENDSFRKDLCFTHDVFFPLAKSPRCVGRPVRNFARWSVVGRIL